MVNEQYHKKFLSLHKKEPVSPIECIYNEHNKLKDNVVRRPSGQCLGNLKYENVCFDKKTGKYYVRQNYQSIVSSPDFVITDEWKDRVKCFIMWNFGFGRFVKYNDFVDAMVYDYCRFGRKKIPVSIAAKEAEERCVRYYVRNEIDAMRQFGYNNYRATFEIEHPEYFISKERRVFRCLDNTLTREGKIKACHQHKRDIRNGIFDSFSDRIMKSPNTVHTWFSHRKDSEGHERICFSDKAIIYLDKRFKNNGLKPAEGVRLFREFCRRIKERSNDKNFTIRKFIHSCAMSCINVDKLKKTIKKIEKDGNMKVLSIYKKALKMMKKIIRNSKEKIYYPPRSPFAPTIEQLFEMLNHGRIENARVS